MQESAIPFRSDTRDHHAKCPEPTLFAEFEATPECEDESAFASVQQGEGSSRLNIVGSSAELASEPSDECGGREPAEPTLDANDDPPRLRLADDEPASSELEHVDEEPAEVKPAETSETPVDTDAKIPSVIDEPMPVLPRRGEIAGLAVPDRRAAPKRIGSGRLVPARLTWKPGDPFSGSRSRSAGKPFRWEVMLTAACVTAACGMGCIWLLRTILA